MKTHFDKSFLENATETLRAVAHPIRIAIIDLLFDNGQMTVTDIYTKLNIEQAIASHHLRILKNKGVLEAERDGKNSLIRWLLRITMILCASSPVSSRVKYGSSCALPLMFVIILFFWLSPKVVCPTPLFFPKEISENSLFLPKQL